MTIELPFSGFQYELHSDKLQYWATSPTTLGRISWSTFSQIKTKNPGLVPKNWIFRSTSISSRVAEMQIKLTKKNNVCSNNYCNNKHFWTALFIKNTCLSICGLKFFLYWSKLVKLFHYYYSVKAVYFKFW